MDKQEMLQYIGKAEMTVAQAMQRIDANAGGVLFLTDPEDHLFGCITDGDIRRYLLAGGKMEDGVSAAANRSPKAARSLGEAKQLYHKKNYVAIPILGADKEILDIYTGRGLHAGDFPRDSLRVPVVINAGGRGTRLDPFTRVLPKPLIPVGDYPIIELIMKEYQTYDCNDFHIIVNYKRDLMKAYFHDSTNDYRITWYDEDEPLGTGGGLSLLKGKMHGTFFFANCDALLTANYSRMLQFHRDHQNAITMICAYKNLTIPYGIVEMGVNGKIEGMKEKPMYSFLTNTGIYIVEPYVVEEMEDNQAIGFPDIVEQQRLKGRNVAVFPVSENDWMDMGQLSELEKMRKKLYGE